jgi:hypothetical protein
LGTLSLGPTNPIGPEHFTNDHKTWGGTLSCAVPTGSVLGVAPKVPIPNVVLVLLPLLLLA